MTSRLGWPNSRGKLELESKQAMRARNLPSPDRADAVLGAMMPAQGGGFSYTRVETPYDADRVSAWLKRFPVTVMVTAWDSKEDAIHIPSKNGESFLMGYVNLQTGKLVQKWGLLKNEEMPAGQNEPKYLEQVYKGVPFQLQEDVRQKAQSELVKWRTTVLTARFIILFIFVIPVLIEIVGLGVAWLGHTLSGISITAGLYKLVKHIGWIKPSKRQQEKDKEERRKEHYFYHCELNPAGFNRLKVENSKRDAIERTRKEAEMLKKPSLERTR